MNPSSPPRIPSKSLLSPAKARNYLLLNLLGTPGLGSLLAGKVVEGLLQLFLAVGGFVLVVLWFVQMSLTLFAEINGSEKPNSQGWIGGLGALLFAGAWVWALTTSLRLKRQAEKNG